MCRNPSYSATAGPSSKHPREPILRVFVETLRNTTLETPDASGRDLLGALTRLDDARARVHHEDSRPRGGVGDVVRQGDLERQLFPPLQALVLVNNVHLWRCRGLGMVVCGGGGGGSEAGERRRS